MATQSILIVDDEYGLAELLREMLRESGYDVILAINGCLAFEILGERTVDLVLTDLMMPVMDGRELASALRRDARHENTSIILMTSLPADRHHADDIFDAVLRKPFAPDRLLEVIVTSLAKRLEERAD